MDPAVFAALAEPNRLRIVELLDAAPRSVGEIAQTLGLRQPQATKHLQTLARAGLVVVHPLGQRRIYALRRDALREAAGWLDALADGDPSEDALEQYAAAIAAEERAAGRRGGRTRARTLRFERALPAPRDAVWRAWTSADGLRRWFHPDHFAVADCTVEPVPGGALRVVLEERDGTRHTATGRFVEVRPPEALRFELGPLGPDGAPLFTTTCDVRLADRGAGSGLELTIDVPEAAAAAAPALAGLRLGWEQQLARLAAELAPPA